jgi:hypothetical protein
VLAAEGDDQVAHLDALLRVEARRGLVEDEYRRLVDDRLGKSNALLESLREGGHPLVGDLPQVGTIDGAVHGGGTSRARDVLDLSDEPEELAVSSG